MHVRHPSNRADFGEYGNCTFRKTTLNQDYTNQTFKVDFLSEIDMFAIKSCNILMRVGKNVVIASRTISRTTLFESALFEDSFASRV